MGKRGERAAAVPGASPSSRTSYTRRVIISGPTHRSSPGSPLHQKWVSNPHSRVYSLCDLFSTLLSSTAVTTLMQSRCPYFSHRAQRRPSHELLPDILALLRISEAWVNIPRQTLAANAAAAWEPRSPLTVAAALAPSAAFKATDLTDCFKDNNDNSTAGCAGTHLQSRHLGIRGRSVPIWLALSYLLCIKIEILRELEPYLYHLPLYPGL